MSTRVISVEGLPEPFVRGLELLVQAVRGLTRPRDEKRQPPPKLPVWSLGVKGRLTRDEIYDDRV
jgi:hypothetical protein